MSLSSCFMFHVFTPRFRSSCLTLHFRYTRLYNLAMDIDQYVNSLGQSARRASRQLATLNGAARVSALVAMAGALRESRAELRAANRRTGRS